MEISRLEKFLIDTHIIYGPLTMNREFSCVYPSICLCVHAASSVIHQRHNYFLKVDDIRSILVYIVS